MADNRPVDSRLTAEQLSNNAASRPHREDAKPHRERVTRLLLDHAPSSEAGLCVLGAGNTNDLDLPKIVAGYQRVDLLDLDEQAVRHGVAAQGLPAERVGVLAPCDVTGVWDELGLLADRPDDHQAIERVIAAAADPARSKPISGARYATVASTCLLSQLIESAVATLGQRHKKLPELALALRDAHLRLVSRLTAPAGSGVLVIDFTSSDTAPDLPHCPAERLPQRLRTLINEGNFFSGLNPFRVAKVLSDSAEAWGIVEDSVGVSEPWRWRLGERVFAVTAVTFRKAGRDRRGSAWVHTP